MWEPWKGSNVWKSKAEFYSWLRGGLRKSVWSRYPTKNEFKKAAMFNVTDDHRVKYGLSKLTRRAGRCEMCRNVFVGKNLQVDHVIPAGSINDESDILGFIKRLCCDISNMRLVCKDCNMVLAYADKHNMTYEEAFLEKRVIKFINQNSTKKIIEILDQNGADSTNAKIRRESLKQLMKEGKI